MIIHIDSMFQIENLKESCDSVYWSDVCALNSPTANVFQKIMTEKDQVNSKIYS